MRWLLTLCLVGGLGCLAWWWNVSAGSAELRAVEDQLPTASVERRTIRRDVELAGDISPATQVEIKSEVTARIKRILKRVGDSVRSGEVVLELDDTGILNDRAAVETEVEGAVLRLERAQRDYEIKAGLFKRGLVARQIFQDSESEKLLAANNLEQARKRLRALEDQLAKTRVSAPINGRVLSIPVVEGEVAVGANSVNQGKLLMVVADLGELLISTHVNQVDVTELTLHQKAFFRVDALGEREMEGEVSSIAPIATVRNNIKGYEVIIRISDPDPGLRPGMTADVRIPVAEAVDVLSVPITAIFRSSDDPRRQVAFVRTPEGVEERVVETGLLNLQFVEIRRGLAEHEEVLLSRPRFSLRG